MKQGKQQVFKLLGMASSIGLALVLATVIGLAIGYYLDRWLGTSPILTLIFLGLGIIAGFRNLYIIMKKIQRMEDSDK